MKDWYVLLSDLTDEQEQRLEPLFNEVRVRDGRDRMFRKISCDRTMGMWEGSLNYWVNSYGKQVTYEGAVKRLNKMIEEKQNEKTRKY